ncbi:MAG: hypothetical protein GC149_06215 [Gammaproteobacteria bacterium]|nr:hypothetical protein [Gammaproteobacteria bacterium]
MWKKIRIAILLFILFLVAADTYLTHYRAVSWDETLWVAIYPINPDRDPVVERYISQLSNRSFAPIDAFFADEAQRNHLTQAKPFKVMLAHTVDELPPEPPQDRNTLQVAWWSLKLRWWAYSHDHSGFSPHIKMFVIYHNYDRVKRLEHSLGMQKGMIGVVHAYAHRELEGRNNLVIAHEMLHTVGATDKYDLQSGLPIFPDGYAEPDKKPLYPQQYAELMGAFIPIDKTSVVMPRSLNFALLGAITLTEINWLR